MTRVCKKCEVERDDDCFKYGKVMRPECRDCHNEWRREAAKKYKEKACEATQKGNQEETTQKRNTEKIQQIII